MEPVSAMFRLGRACLLALAVAVAGTAFGGVTNLFLLVGQSNMAGRGRIAAGDEIPCARIFKVMQDGTLQPATEPLHTDKRSAGAGLAMSFARAYADEHPEVTVGLVPCAVGGSPISSWEPGRGKNYLAMLERVKAVRGHGRFVGILWHQGEADGHNRKEVDAYRRQLEALIAGLRRDVADVPFVAGELGRYLADFRKRGSDELAIPLWEEINRITHEVCESTPRCACVSSEGLKPNPDILHFRTESLREFGRRYYRAWKSLVP